MTLPLLAGVVIGCPGQPGLLQWFTLAGGVLHVLVFGVLCVVVWERAQDAARRRRGDAE